MEIEQFTLLELLQSRKWLMMAIHSTDGFIKLSGEQVRKAQIKIKKIDEELAARIIDGKQQEIFCIEDFEDKNFDETIKELGLEDAKIEKIEQ